MIYIVRCVIELTTPLHCGGGQSGGVLDSPVTRDAYGLWRMAGSSLAGILREYTELHWGQSVGNTLFGSIHKETDSSSRVWCSDMVLLDYDGSMAWKHVSQGKLPKITAPSFVRDHVKINLERGAAEDGGKFDMEYIPAGTRFSFEVTLDGWQESLQEDCVRWFGHIVKAVQQGELQWGGKTGSGYGQYRTIQCQGRYFDLQQENAMNQWLNLQDGPYFEEDCGETWEPKSLPVEADMQEKISGYIDIPLKNKGPVLIGGGMSYEADISFATTAWCNQEKQAYEQKYILPATSLKGVIRHRVFYILQTLGMDLLQRDFDTLFGFVKGEDSLKSKVSICDAVLSLSASQAEGETVVQHVAIDRFTGGALDGHLFNEAPLWQNNLTTSLRVVVHAISAVEAALLFHAVLDVAQGKVAIGSGGNRGNGRFIQDISKPLQYEFTWKGQKVSHADTAHLEAWLAEVDKELSQVREGA